MSDIFREIPGNPVPQHASGGFLVAPDHKRLRFGLFAATGRPLKGTVILLSGRNEHIEKYFETVGDLQRRGFGVATLDWRGQGFSERLIRDPHRGFVRSFNDYARDLDHFFEEIVLPDCRGPFYLLGHSTGALIALLAAPSLVNRVRRMVLIAPFFASPAIPLSVAATARIAKLLTWIGLGRIYVGWGKRPAGGTAFDDNTLTSDPQRYRRNVTLADTFPELSLGGPTIAWVAAAAEASLAVSDSDFMARIQIPVLFIGAGADRVVSTPAIEEYARRLRGGSLLTIDGARHEILQDADIYREQFWAAFDAFVPGSDIVD